MKITPRCPSAARLRAIGVDQPEKFRARAKAGFEWERHYHKSHAVAAFLEELNALSGHHGVESLYHIGNHDLWYLNAGDVYTATVFYNSATDNLFISDLATASGAERR